MSEAATADNIRYFTPRAAQPLTWVRSGSTWRAVEGHQKFTVEVLASGGILARMHDDATGAYAVATHTSVEQAKAWCSCRRSRFSVALQRHTEREGA